MTLSSARKTVMALPEGGSWVTMIHQLSHIDGFAHRAEAPDPRWCQLHHSVTGRAQPAGSSSRQPGRPAAWSPTGREAGSGRDARTGGLVTLPDRDGEVHTCSRRGDPSTRARTRWMFGFHRRFVRRWEWLMLIPNDGFLPQTSHTAAIARQLPSNSSGNADKVSILLMGALETLGATDLRRSISAFRDALRVHQDVINRSQCLSGPRRRHRHEHGIDPGDRGRRPRRATGGRHRPEDPSPMRVPTGPISLLPARPSPTAR